MARTPVGAAMTNLEMQVRRKVGVGNADGADDSSLSRLLLLATSARASDP